MRFAPSTCGSHPLNPLDVWVWEVMARHGMLHHAVATSRPMINRCVRRRGVAWLRSRAMCDQNYITSPLLWQCWSGLLREDALGQGETGCGFREAGIAPFPASPCESRSSVEIADLPTLVLSAFSRLPSSATRQPPKGFPARSLRIRTSHITSLIHSEGGATRRDAGSIFSSLLNLARLLHGRLADGLTRCKLISCNGCYARSGYDDGACLMPPAPCTQGLWRRSQ